MFSILKIVKNVEDLKITRDSFTLPCQYQWNIRAVVRWGALGTLAPPEFGVSEKEDRKRNGRSITISTPRFENLMIALNMYVNLIYFPF